MTREHAILFGFIILVAVTFVFVVAKGIHCPKRFYGGVFALIALSAVAIGLHCYRAEGGSFTEFANTSLSLPEIGLSILLIALACLGCMCADQRGSGS